MSLAARVLKAMQLSPVSLSGKDLRDRYMVSNPSPVLKKLQEAGCIVEDYRHGNEVFWAPVPGAVAPSDARVERMKRVQPLGVRARAMRKLGQIDSGVVAASAHPTAAPGVRRPKRRAKRIRA